MKTKVLMVLALATCAAALSVPVQAHHAVGSVYESKDITVKGVVTNLEWVNPHSWLTIDVPKPDGTVERWHVEGGSPSVLLRLGWNRNTLPPGLKIKVVAFQAKDGQFRASSRDIEFPDGKRMNLGGSSNADGKEPGATK